MPTSLQVAADPKFQALPSADKLIIMGQVDPDFAALPDSDKPTVLTQMQRHALTRPDLVAPPMPAKPLASPEYSSPIPNVLPLKNNILDAMIQPAGELAAGMAYDPAARKQTAKYGLASAAAVTGAALGPGAASAAGEAVLPTAIKAVQGVGTWARAHPYQAYAVYHTLRKYFGGQVQFIKNLPDPIE